MIVQKGSWSTLLLATLLCHFSTWTSGSNLTDEFALELLHDHDGISVAKEIAKQHGFDLLYHAHQLGNVYHLRHRTACKESGTADDCARDAATLSGALAGHPRVLRAVHQVAEEVEKKWLPLEVAADGDLPGSAAKKHDEEEEEEDAETYKKALSKRRLHPKFNDPHFGLQWYLLNVGQFKGVNPGLDLNLLPAWNKGFFGSGVVVTVVDDGIDVKNPDLTRYDPLASADLNNLTNWAGVPIRTGRLSVKETHGTACAGEIGAAANNSFCGIGVAPKCSLGGIRILDGIVTDLLEAYAVLHNNQYISVYSCSWGPKDNGYKMDMPKFYTSKALGIGVTKGRGGKGSIYVMASGNGGTNDDNCGADGFVNSPYTIAVAALNIYGQTPMYGESCSAVHVAAPVGGRASVATGLDPHVTTTMVNGGCFNQMSGTSAATPLVSACIALALEANGNLTWRDVQHLLARSARLPGGASAAGAWQVNGAGRFVSHHAGFGLLDCARLVFNAQTWRSVPEQVTCQDAKPFRGKFRVPVGKPLTLPFVSSGCGGAITRLEHVLVTVTTRGDARRGDLELWLESPAGTKSRLLGRRPRDKDRRLGIKRQTFLSLLSWDENPRGRWLLRVAGGRGRAVVTEASILWTGTGGVPAAATGRRARWLTKAETAAAFRRQRLEAAAQEVLHPDMARLSNRLSDALADSQGAANLADIVAEARSLVSRKAASESGLTDWDLRHLLEQIDSALLPSSS